MELHMYNAKLKANSQKPLESILKLVPFKNNDSQASMNFRSSKEMTPSSKTMKFSQLALENLNSPESNPKIDILLDLSTSQNRKLDFSQERNTEGNISDNKTLLGQKYTQSRKITSLKVLSPQMIAMKLPPIEHKSPPKKHLKHRSMALNLSGISDLKNEPRSPNNDSGFLQVSGEHFKFGQKQSPKFFKEASLDYHKRNFLSEVRSKYQRSGIENTVTSVEDTNTNATFELFTENLSPKGENHLKLPNLNLSISPKFSQPVNPIQYPVYPEKPSAIEVLFGIKDKSQSNRQIQDIIKSKKRLNVRGLVNHIERKKDRFDHIVEVLGMEKEEKHFPIFQNSKNERFKAHFGKVIGGVKF